MAELGVVCGYVYLLVGGIYFCTRWIFAEDTGSRAATRAVLWPLLMGRGFARHAAEVIFHE